MPRLVIRPAPNNKMTLTMSWTPINPAHAIERVRVIVKFRENIPGKVSRQMSEGVAKLRHETRLNGPLPLSNVNIALQVDKEGKPIFATQESKVPQGWQYARSSTAGEFIEHISVMGDQMAYETVEYRRWVTFKQRFSKIAFELFDIASNLLEVDVISLEYFDRFFFDGPRQSALPSDLLVGMQGSLHPDAFSGHTLWHLHRGWFQMADGGQVLVNQNLDASEAALPGRGEPVRMVAIYTKIDLRADMFDVEGKPVLSQLDFLHDLSKHYFRAALQPQILRSVGITDTSKP